MESGGLTGLGSVRKPMTLKTSSHRFFFLLFFLVQVPCLGQPPISVEWKQRATNSLRTHILKMGINPFDQQTEPSATPNHARFQAPAEEPVSLLSSLTNLLTRATTETLSLSREIRPSIEWPKKFWNFEDSEEWRWTKRFKWFQEGNQGEVLGATRNIGDSSRNLSLNSPTHPTSASEEVKP